MRFFLSDGLIPSLELEGVTQIVSSKGTLDACNRLLRHLSELNPEVTPVVLIAVGSLELSLDLIGGKIPISHIKNNEDKYVKKIVDKIINPIRILSTYLRKYRGKLMIASLIPLPRNVKIPTLEYKSVLRRAYNAINSDIHDLNQEANARSFHLGVKFEKRNHRMSSADAACKDTLFSDDDKLSDKGMIEAKLACEKMLNSL